MLYYEIGLIKNYSKIYEERLFNGYLIFLTNYRYELNKNSSFKYSLIIYPILYLMPLYFIFKGSNIKKMSFMRYLFIIPALIMHQSVRENIKIYSIIDGQSPQFIKTNKS